MRKKVISFLKRNKCKVIETDKLVLLFRDGFYGALAFKPHNNSRNDKEVISEIQWFNDNSFGKVVTNENWPEVKAELEQML